MNQYLLGIDIGTSGCKSIIIDEHGKIISEAFSGYNVDIPKPGWSEQNPEDWWQAVKLTVSELLRNFQFVSNIRCIGLSGQMHGMVLMDKYDRVLRPCILWSDQRNEKQCLDIQERAGGIKNLIKMTNNKMLTGYTGGKIIWSLENEPMVFQKTKVVLNPKDYIRFKLTGEYATEVSDASGTGLFNVKKRMWSDELLNKLGISKSILPTCYESTEISGRLSGCASEVLGLPYDLPVTGGGGDAIIQSIGSCKNTGKSFCAILGTGGQITTSLDYYCENPDGALQIFCNVIPGKWHAMGVMLTAGGALRWFKDVLSDESSESTSADYFRKMDNEASLIPVGSENLLFLPYLSGERCPHNDPNARGAFIGLNLKHGRSHFVRSVLEGVAFGFKDLANNISKLGIKPESVYMSGGGANSFLWRQILSDILNMNVYTLNSAGYGGAYGAALIAGLSIGIWPSIEKASESLKIETENNPVSLHVSQYNALYQIYRQLYPALWDSFNSIARIANY